MRRERSRGGIGLTVALLLAAVLGSLGALVPIGVPPIDASTGDLGGYTVAQLAQQPHSQGKGQGSAVAVAGGIAAVSNGGTDSEGTDDGNANVYIYAEDHPTPGAWGLAATLSRSSADGNGSHRWGQVLTLAETPSGTVLAVGDPDWNCSDVTGDTADNCTGQVVLFTMGADATSWTYWHTMTPDFDYEKNNLGSALALEGSWLVAGAPGEHLGDIYDGQDYPSAPYVEIWDLSEGPSGTPTKVFKKRTWDFKQPLLGALFSQLGAAVTIDGDYAFFGAPYGQNAGDGVVCTAQYYAKGTDSAGNPNQPAWHTITPCLAAEGYGSFGAALAFSQESMMLAVGAPTADDNSGSSGAVVMYDVVPGLAPSCANFSDGCLSLETTGFGDGALLGTALAMSEDGAVLVAGAPGADDAAGAVAVYERELSDPPDLIDSYAMAGTFDAEAYRQDGAAFGSAVALGAGTTAGEQLALFGAPQQSNPDPPKSTGFAYVYTTTADTAMGMAVTADQKLVDNVDGATVTLTATLTNGPSSEALGLTTSAVASGPGTVASLSIAATGGYAPAGFWDCPAFVFTCTASAPYPAGAATTFTITITLDGPNLTLPGIYDVWAQARWTNPGVGALVTGSDFIIVGQPAPPGAATLTAAPASAATVIPGTDAVFDVVLTNAGLVPLQSPSVSVVADVPLWQLPVAVTLTTAAAGWTCSTSVCVGPTTWQPGSPVTFEATAPVPMTSAVALGGTTALDLDASANWQNSISGLEGTEAATSAQVGSPLVITQDTPASVDLGEPAVVTLELTNTSAQTLTGLAVAFNVEPPYGPADVTTSTTGPTAFDCPSPLTIPGDGVVQDYTCATPPGGNSLPPGSSTTIELSVVFANFGDQPGRSYVAGFNFMPTVSGPVAIDYSWFGSTMDVRAGSSDTAISAALVSPAPEPGGTATISVTGSNHGPSVAPRPTYRFRPAGPVSLRTLRLPDGSTFGLSTVPTDDAAASEPAWTCRWDGSDAVCTGQRSAHPGETHQIEAQIDVSADAIAGSSGSLSMSIESIADETDPSNNQVAVSVPIRAPVAGSATTTATTTVTSAGTLPVSGADLHTWLLAAVLLVGTGSLVLISTRRRGGPSPEH